MMTFSSWLLLLFANISHRCFGKNDGMIFVIDKKVLYLQ